VCDIYIQIKTFNMKVYTKIEEFLATKPQTNPQGPAVLPGTKPGEREKPQPPGRPSPVRRDKPAADPEPKASAEEVVEMFMKQLKRAKAPIEFNIGKLKQRYND